MNLKNKDFWRGFKKVATVNNFLCAWFTGVTVAHIITGRYDAAIYAATLAVTWLLIGRLVKRIDGLTEQLRIEQFRRINERILSHRLIKDLWKDEAPDIIHGEQGTWTRDEDENIIFHAYTEETESTTEK